MKLFTLTHPFDAKDRAEIYATLLDFTRFGAIHPLMKSVKLVNNNSEGVATYAVKEDVKIWGWLPVKPHYLAHVRELIAGEKIVLSARLNGILHLQVQLSFSEVVENKMDLIEQVEISRIPIMTGIFVKIFTEAHTAAFANLRKQLSNRQTHVAL